VRLTAEAEFDETPSPGNPNADSFRPLVLRQWTIEPGNSISVTSAKLTPAMAGCLFPGLSW